MSGEWIPPLNAQPLILMVPTRYLFVFTILVKLVLWLKIDWYLGNYLGTTMFSKTIFAS